MDAGQRALDLGFLCAYAGRWDEGLTWLTTARDQFLHCGDAVGASIAAKNLGEMLVKQRRFDDAEPVLKDVLRVMRASGYSEGVALVEVQLAEILIARGELAAAETMLARVVEHFSQSGQAMCMLEASIVRASGRVRAGDAATALELLERATTAAAADAAVMGPALAWARASALIAQRRFDEADQEVVAGLAAARQQNLPYEEAMLLLLKGDVAVQLGGDVDEAALDVAEGTLERLGVQRTPRRVSTVRSV